VSNNAFKEESQAANADCSKSAKNVKPARKLRVKRGIISIILAAVLLAFDQFTKKLAVKKLMGKPAFVLIEGVLELDYLENRGVAFGMLQGHRWPILIFGVVLMTVLCWLIFKLPEGKKYSILQIILTCIIAGGIGNMIDRLFYGYVIDFISFVLINYPIFNVADCYVVCATIALFVMLIFYMKDEDLEFLTIRKSKQSETFANADISVASTETDNSVASTEADISVASTEADNGLDENGK